MIITIYMSFKFYFFSNKVNIFYQPLPNIVMFHQREQKMIKKMVQLLTLELKTLKKLNRQIYLCKKKIFICGEIKRLVLVIIFDCIKSLIVFLVLQSNKINKILKKKSEIKYDIFSQPKKS